MLSTPLVRQLTPCVSALASKFFDILCCPVQIVVKQTERNNLLRCQPGLWQAEHSKVHILQFYLSWKSAMNSFTQSSTI